MLTIKQQDVKTIELLKDVRFSHEDRTSPHYNACDYALCGWCEEAERLLESLQNINNS